MKIFAASYYVRKQTKDGAIIIDHVVDVIKASNYKEALGIGYEWLNKLYPTLDGWGNYDVRIQEVNIGDDNEGMG